MHLRVKLDTDSEFFNCTIAWYVYRLFSEIKTCSETVNALTPVLLTFKLTFDIVLYGKYNKMSKNFLSRLYHITKLQQKRKQYIHTHTHTPQRNLKFCNEVNLENNMFC